MMQVPDAGPFVRCLLPVHLTGGFTLTFGVWLAVHPDDLQHAFRVWWEPEYRELELDALLANRLPVWVCWEHRHEPKSKTRTKRPTSAKASTTVSPV